MTKFVLPPTKEGGRQYNRVTPSATRKIARKTKGETLMLEVRA